MRRKTIGVMLTGINGSYLTDFWLMMKKASEKHNCNLFVYDGRALKHSKDTDGKHSIIYNFVNKNRIDGLVIFSSTIANFIDDLEFDLFLKRFEGIPLVSVGRKVPDAISILVDSKEGMKEQIRHLINHHGYRKIAFVKGPETNLEALERYEAYLEVLEENNIKKDPDIIFQGDFIFHTGYEIMKNIIIKNTEYDAIVFSNDDMALGAASAIVDLSQKYNFDTAKKGIMCGFDDSINLKFTKPYITTVRQPFEEICNLSLKALLDKIDGKGKEKVYIVPSVLVIRESCGCKSEKNLNDISDNNILDNYLKSSNIMLDENVQTYSLEELYDRITKLLKLCNLNSLFISKYVGGTILYKDEYLFNVSYDIPEKSELLYAFYNGERIDCIKEDIKYFDTKDVVPDSYIPFEKRFIYLLTPLFFDREHLGIMCVDATNANPLELQMLKIQVSNSLKGALMLLERGNVKRLLPENESLALLGHLLGNVSHDLMTPIMSISGAATVLEDLVDEYKDSIGDRDVTIEDHHEISNEMKKWIKRIKDFNSHISKAVSTVKNQAVRLGLDITNKLS
ncbi:substrate-binding domain-containing protein [Acetivibrio saccincola]|uniref:substrate-binding domain-containing protein n=1 Tax=Acetivibrio saccincola TaxID=1677857 RepID=UPI00169818CA|nr:substrate-binding domain-containing protein [Acetivibrio saccincola]NLW26625.1 substrate-binding domain-containing protein [Acetivibrio saccincola]